MHSIKVNAVTLSMEKKVFLRHRIFEIQIELFTPSVGSNALRAGSADCFNGGIHSRPVVEWIQHMVNFGVPLMVYFQVRALDERLLLFHWNDDSLTGVSVRCDGQESMRVSLHRQEATILIQVFLGNLLSKGLSTYLSRERRLSLLTDDNVLH